MSTWKHAANEWADMAINGLQGLRNIKDGISTVEEVLQNMEQCLLHCREVDNSVKPTEVTPEVVKSGKSVSDARSIASSAPSTVSATTAVGSKTRAVTPEMIEAAESVEDLYRRGTPETWAKVFRAMLAAERSGE